MAPHFCRERMGFTQTTTLRTHAILVKKCSAAQTQRGCGSPEAAGWPWWQERHESGTMVKAQFGKSRLFSKAPHFNDLRNGVNKHIWLWQKLTTRVLGHGL